MHAEVVGNVVGGVVATCCLNDSGLVDHRLNVLTDHLSSGTGEVRWMYHSALDGGRRDKREGLGLVGLNVPG